MANLPIKHTGEIPKGTLIAIPIDEGKYALSQVYHPGVVFYIVIYNGLWPLDIIHSVSPEEIVMASWTNDAEVYRGHWVIVGEEKIKLPVKEPSYKVLVSGREMVESFDGSAKRTANAGDSLLRNRKSRSPLILEDAIRAFYGFGKWSPRYDDLLTVNRKS
jgi:hypothetical protein